MEKRTKKVVLAVILILVAGYMVLSKLNIPIIGSISLFGHVSFWDLLWSFIMLVILWEGITKREFFLIFVPIAIFASIHAEAFHLTAVTPWPLIGAAVLVSIACNMLFPGRSKIFHVNVNGKDGTIHRSKGGTYIEYEDGTRADWQSEVGNETDTSLEVNFGSSVKYFNDPAFKQADVECNFGNVKAYFLDAVMQDTEAFITAEQNFGETEIFIPDTWAVDLRKDKAFGNVSVLGAENWDGVHTVHINAEANFGSIVIHRVQKQI